MELTLYEVDDPVLREKSEDVTEFNEELEDLCTSMSNSLKQFGGIGLAAVQVGIKKRLFVIDIGKDNDGYEIFINPVIISTSEDRVPYNEGCLSVPEQFADVYRPSRVEIMAQDVHGNKFTYSASGLKARVIQHEYDHLDGKLFIDRIPEEEKNLIMERYLAKKNAMLKASEKLLKKIRKKENRKKKH